MSEMAEIAVEDLLLALEQSPGNDMVLRLLANKLGEDSKLEKAEVSHVVKEVQSQLKLCAGRSEVEHLCCIILSNLTVKEDHCSAFLESDIKNFITKFLSHNPQKENQSLDYSKDEVVVQADPWAHVGSILCNVCRVEEGRKAVLKISDGYIPKIASQLRSLNVVRRKGAVGAIRSCLFDSEVHWWMVHEAKVMYHILFPLVPNVPFEEKDKEGMDPRLWLAAEDKEKVYEPDATVRKMLLECIVLLCQKKDMRYTLRSMRVYPIVRALDLEQEDEAVNEVIFEIVNLLMRDEEGERSAWDPVMPEEGEKEKEKEKEKDDVPEEQEDTVLDMVD
jgi:hypothetical protein